MGLLLGSRAVLLWSATFPRPICICSGASHLPQGRLLAILKVECSVELRGVSSISTSHHIYSFSFSRCYFQLFSTFFFFVYLDARLQSRGAHQTISDVSVATQYPSPIHLPRPSCWNLLVHLQALMRPSPSCSSRTSAGGRGHASSGERVRRALRFGTFAGNRYVSDETGAAAGAFAT